MELFGAPEGKKLFLLTQARKALNTARLFMSAEEMEIIETGRSVANDKIEDLFDQAVEKGWKPNSNDGTFERIECDAQLHAEKKVKGFKDALLKLDSLFGSVAVDE